MKIKKSYATAVLTVVAAVVICAASAGAEVFPKLEWTCRIKPDVDRANLIFMGGLMALAGTENTVHFIDINSGKSIWQYGFNSPVSLYAADDNVVIASSGRLLHKLNAGGRRREWTVVLSRAEFEGLAYSDAEGRVAVVYSDGAREIIDPAGVVSQLKKGEVAPEGFRQIARADRIGLDSDLLGEGTELIIRYNCVSFAQADPLERGWSVCFDRPPASAAAIAANKLFIVSPGGTATALDPGSGRTIQEIKLPELIDMRFWDEKPAAIDNYSEAAMFSRDGSLYVIGPSAVSRINFKGFPKEVTVKGVETEKQKESTLEWSLDRAIKKWDEKNYTTAVQMLREVALAWPDSVNARLFLGMAYSSGGYFDEAINELERAFELDPRNPDVAYNLVGNYMIKVYSLDPETQADKAIEMYGKAIKTRPDFELPYVGLSEIYLSRRDYAGAIRTLESAFENAFFGHGFHDLLLGAYYMSDRRGDSLALVDRIIKMFPDSDVAYMLKGKLLCKNGRYAAAAKVFEQTPARNRENDVSAYPRLLAAGSDFFYGNALGLLGRYPQAVDFLFEYVDALPTVQQMKKLRELEEKQLQKSGDEEKEPETAQKDIGISDRYAGRPYVEINAETEFKTPALLAAAHFLYRSGKFAESVKIIDRIIKYTKPDPETMSYIGYLYSLNNRRLSDAGAYVETSLNAVPEDPVYLRNYAVYLSRVKKFKDAESVFKKALNINPDTELLHFEYGQMLSKSGRAKEAEEQYKIELKLTPDLAMAKEALEKSGKK